MNTRADLENKMIENNAELANWDDMGAKTCKSGDDVSGVGGKVEGSDGSNRGNSKHKEETGDGTADARDDLLGGYCSANMPTSDAHGGGDNKADVGVGFRRHDDEAAEGMRAVSASSKARLMEHASGKPPQAPDEAKAQAQGGKAGKKGQFDPKLLQLSLNKWLEVSASVISCWPSQNIHVCFCVCVCVCVVFEHGDSSGRI
jgi:hypothetical protein